MKTLLIILILFTSSISIAQNEAYYVKQTQISFDGENWMPLSDNRIFGRVVVSSKGIYYWKGTEQFYSDFSKFNKVFEGKTDFRYELADASEMGIAFFFAAYPYKDSKPRLYMSIVSIAGLDESEPNKITFFRMVFLDDLVK